MAPILSSPGTTTARELHARGLSGPAGMMLTTFLLAVVLPLLILLACGIALCCFLSRRNKARKAPVFVPPQYQYQQKPVALDQVPMLAPPPQDPFTDAAAAAPGYGYGQPHSGYAPNTGWYAPPAPAPVTSSGYAPGYDSNPYAQGMYPSTSQTNFALPNGNSSYPQVQTPGVYPQVSQSQTSFAPPPGPPVSVIESGKGFRTLVAYRHSKPRLRCCSDWTLPFLRV
ncbi:hypothetical protein DFH06DRAFT_1143235 [Mycena polygramma]|nr:hypothetical protein DFH06DRAFT_1143235 [Mycena polygramma]